MTIFLKIRTIFIITKNQAFRFGLRPFNRKRKKMLIFSQQKISLLLKNAMLSFFRPKILILNTFSCSRTCTIAVLGLFLVAFWFPSSASAQATADTSRSHPPNEKHLPPVSDSLETGYGSYPQKMLSGSNFHLDEAAFNPGFISSVEQLIVGKTPGLRITSRGGAPGESSRLLIRGGSSLFRSNEPLIVLDGLPMNNDGLPGIDNSLSFVPAEDIGQIIVLKDGVANALYGARAANGVILIETKKGKREGPLRVQFHSIAAVSSLRRASPVLSAEEFRTMVTEKGTAANQALLGSTSTNWQDVIYQNALSQQQDLSLTGGLTFLPYRLSVGHLNQQGILKTSGFHRNSIGLSLSPGFFDNHLTVQVNLRSTQSNTRLGSPGAIGAATAFDPTQPVYEDNDFGGYFVHTSPEGLPNILAPYNPLSQLEQREEREKAKTHVGNVHLRYALHGLPSLQANLRLAYHRVNYHRSLREEADFARSYTSQGIQTSSDQWKKNLFGEFYLYYDREIKTLASEVSLIAGLARQHFTTHFQQNDAYNAEGDLLYQNGNWQQLEDKILSIYGSFFYRLKNRYVLNASLRKDGSPSFTKSGEEWRLSPSLGAAWVLSEEAFLRNSSFLSHLQLRVSYATTGWEHTENFNSGLDFTLLNGRLTGSVDVYRRNTQNLLLLLPVPGNPNVSFWMKWGGSIAYQGLDASLYAKPVQIKQLHWRLGVNATYSKNTLTNLLGENGFFAGPIAGGTGNTIQLHTVGNPLSSFYAYQQLYNAQGKPLEGAYVDLDRNRVINDSDKQPGFSPEPFLSAGLHSQLSYKKWDVSFLLRSYFGNYLYNNINSRLGAYKSFSNPGYLLNLSSSVLETNFNSPQLFSDYYVENASFLRMEYISLGYKAGAFFNDKAKLSLTATLENAFVLTNYTGTDPEIAGGIENNHYPRPRTFSLTAEICF